MFKKKKDSAVQQLIMEQINDVENCFIHFEGFIHAICVPETVPETIRILSGSIAQAESVADESLRRMIDSLEGGLYLPSTRESLISIACDCDRVANKCESFAKMVVFQNFHFPKEYFESLQEIVSITHAQFDILKKSIAKLFSNFGELLRNHTILDEIRDHESRVDAIEEELYEKIYKSDMDLAHQMQIGNYVELVCHISDIIENIADKIQIMRVTRKA